MSTHTAARAAREAAELLRKDEPLSTVWRLAILQTLDVYESRLRRAGTDAAVRTFHRRPSRPGTFVWTLLSLPWQST